MHELMKTSFWRRLYYFFRKYWILPFIISALPGGIPTFLGVAPDIEKLKFIYYYENNIRFIKPGYAKFFFVCWLISTVFTFLWYILSKNEGYSETKRMLAYKFMCDTAKVYNKEYYNTFMSIINDKKKIYKKNPDNVQKSLKDVSSRFNPIFRLNKVFDNARELLSQTCDIEKSEISIKLIYKKATKKKWRVIVPGGAYGDDLNKLINDPKSTFNSVLDAKNKTVFYADKNQAEAESKYVPDVNEISENLEGSIFCKNLSIYKKDKIKYGFVLAISTDNTKLADPDDEYSINMCKEILNYIVSMIQTEISLICLNKYILEGK